MIVSEPYHLYRERDALSASRLKDFLRSPLYCHLRETGEIPDEDSAARKFGRAAHCLILEGSQAFSERYAVGGPVNEKTGRPYGVDTKAFAEWQAAQGKECVSQFDFNTMQAMDANVKAHPVAFPLLLDGEAERSVVARYRDIDLKIRCDYLTDVNIVDLKTTDDISSFRFDIRRYGYDRAAAFYRMVLQMDLNAAGDSRVPEYYLVAVEKAFPHMVGVWHFENRYLEAQEKLVQISIDRYARCKKTGVWPTGYENVLEYADTL